MTHAIHIPIDPNIILVAPMYSVPHPLDDQPGLLPNELPEGGVWPEVVAVAAYGFTTGAYGDEMSGLLQDCIDRFGDTVLYTTMDVVVDHIWRGLLDPASWDERYLGSAREDALSSGHEGLCFVRDAKRFEWPTLASARLQRVIASSSNTYRDLPATSFLSEAGYSVAKRGPGPVRRREILAQCVDNHGVSQVAHMIAGLIHYRKHRSAMAEAVEKWESDLDWLRACYYRENYGWNWPYYR